MLATPILEINLIKVKWRREITKKYNCKICVTNVSQSVRFNRDGTSQAWGHSTQRPGIEPATVRLRVRHANHYAPDLLAKLSYHLVLKKNKYEYFGISTFKYFRSTYKYYFSYISTEYLY